MSAGGVARLIRTRPQRAHVQVVCFVLWRRQSCSSGASLGLHDLSGDIFFPGDFLHELVVEDLRTRVLFTSSEVEFVAVLGLEVSAGFLPVDLVFYVPTFGMVAIDRRAISIARRAVSWRL
jgi:hypothetical protein